MKGSAALCASAAVAVLLAGCSTALPTDPLPRAGLPVEVQPREDVTRVLPGPRANASAVDIVRGFLRTNVGFAEDDDVAREYLTPTLAGEWVPTSSVLVLEGTPVVTPAESGRVQVSAPISGQIDAFGRLVELPRGTTVTETFELTPVDGQWRISGFPDGFGLWLSRTDLDQAFRPREIVYLNRALGVFVPDVRWLAEGEGLPTSLARAQLVDVPPYLQGAVATGAAGEGRLTVAAVPVDPETRVATVNLQGAGLSEDPGRVRELRAQLAKALLGVDGIQGVDLRLAGRSVDDSGPVTAQTDLGFREVAPRVDRALLRVQDTFVVVDPTVYDLRDAPVSSVAELPTLGLSWTGVAASADLHSLAAVSVDGTELWRWRGGREDVNPGIGDELTPPSFDPHGLLWVAGAARGGRAPRVWYVDADDVNAVARPLDVPDLGEHERIRSFRVSQEGTRALMVVTDADGAGGRLLLAGIARDADGDPTGMDTPMEIAPTLAGVVSARWATTTELIVTARRDGEDILVGHRVPLGGWVRPLGVQEGLTEVLAVPDGDTYTPIARTEDGRFHTTEGTTGWYDARNGDELVIPGS